MINLKSLWQKISSSVFAILAVAMGGALIWGKKKSDELKEEKVKSAKKDVEHEIEIVQKDVEHSDLDELVGKSNAHYKGKRKRARSNDSRNGRKSAVSRGSRS